MSKISNKKRKIGLQILELEDEYIKLKVKESAIRDEINKLKGDFARADEKANTKS